MCSPRNPVDAALVHFATGAGFLALAAAGQHAFLGAGLAFIGLGLGAFVRSRRGC
jgi:hypothetical protein